MSEWATAYISALKEGQIVSFRPAGNSMSPRIKHKQLVTVAPVDPKDIRKHDVVLCQIGRSHYLHLVSAVGDDGRFQISNNHKRVNGWIGPEDIFGRLVKVEP